MSRVWWLIYDMLFSLYCRENAKTRLTLNFVVHVSFHFQIGWCHGWKSLSGKTEKFIEKAPGEPDNFQSQAR